MYVRSWELYTNLAYLSDTVLAGPTRDSLQGFEIESEQDSYDYLSEEGDEEEEGEEVEIHQLPKQQWQRQR